MSAYRKYIIQILTAALILTTMLVVSYQKQSAAKNQEKKSKDPSSNIISTYEERTFELQSKFTLGLLEFMNKQQGQAVTSAGFKELRASLLDAMQAGLIASDKQTAQLGRTKSASLVLKEIIISLFFELSEVKAKKCRLDLINQQLGSNPELLNTGLRLCSHPTDDKASSLSDEKTDLKKQLGWFHNMLLALESPEQQPPDPALRENLYDQAYKLFKKALIIISIVVVLCGLSAILGIYFLSKLVFGKMDFSYSERGMNADYALEIFFLYLLMMNVLPLFLRLPALKDHLLALNAITISCLSLLILWPVLFGISFAEIKDSLGLRAKNAGRLIKDFFAGISSYIASIVPILIILMLYSLILMKMGVDIGSGAHPIVPILTEAKKPSVLIWIILLTVIVAPVVEEIMFRGALYTWLRSRLGAKSSILLSALLFAAIHPQGAVGILPLTCIGVVLAAIREWRGNLTSCMVAHACFNSGTLLIAFSIFR